MTKKEIGAILRKLREEKSLTRDEVAGILEKSPQAIGHWETGTSMPDKYIMLYGGWKSESALHGVYQHALRDRIASTDAQVVGYFGKVVGGKDAK